MISVAGVAAAKAGGASEKGRSAVERKFRNNEKAVRAEPDRQAKGASREKYREKSHDNRARLGKDGSVCVHLDELNYRKTFEDESATRSGRGAPPGQAEN